MFLKDASLPSGKAAQLSLNMEGMKTEQTDRGERVSSVRLITIRDKEKGGKLTHNLCYNMLLNHSWLLLHYFSLAYTGL